MPPIETADRHQKAVLWQSDGVDNYGRYLLLDPHEIDVRWEEGRRESVDPEGNAIAIDARVVVDKEIPIGSILWLGTYASLPASPDNLKQVAFFSDVPDIKNRVRRRTLSLVRYSDSLPDQSTGTGT